MKYIALLMFAATIPAANWLIGNFGTICVQDGPCLVPVGFGLVAPSGVLLIGAALVLRDWLQEIAGWKWSVVGVLIGSGLSLAFAPPQIAVASAVAFGLAEMADLAVYTPLRKKGAAVAVAASGLVGAIVDSCLFVWFAFGSLDFAFGTAMAKFYASIIVATIMALRHSHPHTDKPQERK